MLAQFSAGEIRRRRGALNGNAAAERLGPRAKLHRHRLEGKVALRGVHSHRGRGGAAPANPEPLGQHFLARARRRARHDSGTQQDPHGLGLQAPATLRQNPVGRFLAVRHER